MKTTNKQLNVLTALRKANPNNTYHDRIANGVDVGNYKLSIQASSGHYCIPRENGHIDTFSAYEVGLIKKDGNTIRLNSSSVFRGFPKYDELKSYADDGYGNGGSWVLGYVPVELLDDFYNYLNS